MPAPRTRPDIAQARDGRPTRSGFARSSTGYEYESLPRRVALPRPGREGGHLRIDVPTPPLPLRDARIGALRLPEATGASVRLGRPRTFRVAFANRPGASGWSVTSDPENPIGRALPACRSRGRTAHRPVNHILRYRSDGVVELCALAQQRRVRTSAAGRRTERPRRDGLQDRPLRYRDRETLAGPDCSTSLGGP